MKLTLVRHGETWHNKNHICQGQFNSQLTPLGINQSKMVAERLKNQDFDVIISSDLDRAANTAREIAKYHDCELILDCRLREQAKGSFENKPSMDRKAYLEGKNIPYSDFAYEGGESLKDTWKRVFEFLEEIKEKYTYHKVLLVSHGGPLNTILTQLQNKCVDDLKTGIKLGNTCVSEIDIREDGVDFIKLNCTKHLEDKND